MTKLADSEQLQADLDILQEWEIRWDMQFKPSKCQVIHITRSRSPLPTTYTLHGETLQSVASARYLGVDIANALSWKTHVSKVTNNANKSLGLLRRNLKTKKKKKKKKKKNSLWENAYKAIVRHQLESMLLQYGTPTLRMTYKKLRVSRDEQLDRSLGIIVLLKRHIHDRKTWMAYP